MHINAVKSSTLATVSYDEVRQLLELEFRNRAIYRYFDVPAVVHSALLDAQSKGGYFNHVIRRGFRYCRVSPHDRRESVGIGEVR